MYYERDTRKLRKMLRDDGFVLSQAGSTQSHEKWKKGKERVYLSRTKEIEKESTIRSIYNQAGWL